MQLTERVVGLTTKERESTNLDGKIQGWGADLEDKHRPGVPRDKAPHIGIETLYPDIEPQASDVEILMSIEHQQKPPVYGTTCPPKGLSGAMRRYAFKFSEGSFTHWLVLLFADRVDMVEGIAEDLSHGHIPNLYKEMGLATEWKYNRKNVVKKAAIAGVGLLAITAYLNSRRD